VGSVDAWQYCPRCGSKPRVEGRRAECGACGFVAYSTSEPTACALVVDPEGRLLLARRAHEPYAGKWDLPGGFLEEGEEPLDGLRRELLEETGLDVEPLDFVGAWVDRYGDGDDASWTLNLYWTARPLRGHLQAADDVSELSWFAADDLPRDAEIAFGNVTEAIRTWRDRS
jgi:ADP-ribose pyrophosphatase YjhB (NUDIX family)